MNRYKYFILSTVLLPYLLIVVHSLEPGMFYNNNLKAISYLAGILCSSSVLIYSLKRYFKQ